MNNDITYNSKIIFKIFYSIIEMKHEEVEKLNEEILDMHSFLHDHNAKNELSIDDIEILKKLYTNDERNTLRSKMDTKMDVLNDIINAQKDIKWDELMNKRNDMLEQIKKRNMDSVL